MQNIDKITIAVVSLLLLVGFTFPFLVSDPGSEYSSKISKANEKIELNRDNQDFGDLSIPQVHNEVLSAYDISGEASIPEWAFYRKPARLDVLKRIIMIPPTIEPAYISGVQVIRDADSKATYHEITGRHSLFTNCEIASCALEMKTGDMDWAKVTNLSNFGSGAAFSIKANQLEVGREYSYRIVTKASTGPDQMAFPQDGSHQQESVATGSVLMPADMAWKVSGAQVGRLDSSGQFLPGRATIQYSSWEWDSGSSKKSAKVVTEPAAGEKGDDLFGTGFALERIQDTADGRVVVLRNSKGKRSYLKNNDVPLSLTPSGWDNFDSDPAESGGDEDDFDETGSEPESVEESQPAKAKKKRPSGGGLFGGDDR